MTKLVTESDLVYPALKAIRKSGARGISTSQLSPILRDTIKPSGEDLVILDGRNDDKFSQKVRNLKSHSRLERFDLVTFRGGRYRITDIGKVYLKTHEGLNESYSSQGFSEKVKRTVIGVHDVKAYIEEGQLSGLSRKIKKRSRKLRNYAVKHYQNSDGTINCVGCGFEGRAVYGDTGQGLIEIHHLEPIASSSAMKITLEEAVKKVIPLCPNCHRVVHRGKKLLSLAQLRKIVV